MNDDFPQTKEELDIALKEILIKQEEAGKGKWKSELGLLIVEGILFVIGPVIFAVYGIGIKSNWQIFSLLWLCTPIFAYWANGTKLLSSKRKSSIKTPLLLFSGSISFFFLFSLDNFVDHVKYHYLHGWLEVCVPLLYLVSIAVLIGVPMIVFNSLIVKPKP